MSNLEVLIAAKKSLDWKQAKAFEDYFIGALSILVSQEDWATALGTARTCLENHKEATPQARPVLRG